MDYGLQALPFPDSKTKVLKSKDVPAEGEPQHLRIERATWVPLSETPLPTTICEESCPHLLPLSPACEVQVRLAYIQLFHFETKWPREAKGLI